MTTQSPFAADSRQVEPSSQNGNAAPEGESTPTDDLAKRLEEAEARAAKAEQQLKSTEGRKRKRSEVDELRSEIREMKAFIEGLYPIMGQAFSDNPEVSDYVNKAQQSLKETSSKEALKRQFDEMEDFFSDMDTSDPILKEAHDEYQRAYNRQDWQAMRDAYDQAKVNMRVVQERERIQQEAEKRAEERIAEARKKAQEEADVFNIDTGNSGRSASGGLNDEQFFEQWSNFDLPSTPENVKRANEIAKRRQGVA